MLKRSVLTLTVLAASLAGCTTVSVLPGTATVETQLSKEQSSLRDATTVFGDMATARGWITNSRGLFDMAKVLVDGQSANEAQTTSDYASLIGAEIRTPAEIASTLITDARDAAVSLEMVSAEAQAFLSVNARAQQGTQRGDLVSFERTLVQAQQTRRSFTDAMEIAGLTQDADVNMAITRFDAQIDQARLVADQLATEYSGRAVNGAVS